MNERKMSLIISLIGLTIVCTICVQLYWNFQNYQTNNLLISNEIETGFEEAINTYFTKANEKKSLTIVELNNDSINPLKSTLDFIKTTDFLSKLDSTNEEFTDFDNTQMLTDSFNLKTIRGTPSREMQDELAQFNNSITITFSHDSINLSKLSEKFSLKLKRKKISSNYIIEHFKKDTIFSVYNTGLEQDAFTESLFRTDLIPDGEYLKLKYSNPIKSIFERGIVGIFLSVILAAAIILSLIYLMNVIKNQKQLTEIKNDLISNITHEFKTPITTVSAAIEGIKHFNSKNEQIKTESYLEISQNQLKKLNQMVEKLLETATLDSDKLLLKKEAIDLVFLLEKIVEKYQLIADSKTIEFETNLPSISAHVDVFHFENAVSNLVDNATKYGGDSIEINLNSVLNSIEITVADNGKGIDKNNIDKIFDKFYRIPTGNRHDVKGFGIGLYYTKKIIEKHDGTIVLTTSDKGTIFKITL
jgi:two-component system phosphate regulon sensor histidine kinase PhoR